MSEPKYLEIKRFIIGNIEQSIWAENQRVPSENELSREFSVSRMTARRALQELSDEGVLTRTKGSGTYVAELKSQSSLLEIRNIADEVRERGHQYSCRQSYLGQVTAPKAVCIALEKPIETSLYYSELIHLENDTPIQLEMRYVNPELVPDYLKQDFTKVTPHGYLCDVAPLTEASHTVEAILPGKSTMQSLQIAATEPCLRVIRRTWSTQGVVSYALLTYPGSRYRLGGHMTF
jgi:GntR family histidine utilization transcriptional repressor